MKTLKISMALALIFFLNSNIQAETDFERKQQMAKEMLNLRMQESSQGESIFVGNDSTKRDFSSSSIRNNPQAFQEQEYQPPYQQDLNNYNNYNYNAPQELSEEQITLLKAAARSKNLQAIQKKFFNKKYSGFENTINFNYEKNKTQKITTRVAMATTLIFPTKIDSFILGDKVGFEVEELPNLDNALAIKPKLIGIDTSLTVFTNDKKMHSFYLYSTDYKSTRDPNLIVYINDEKTQNQTQANTKKKEEEYLIIKEGIAELKVKKEDIYDNYLQKGLKKHRHLLAEEIFNDKQYTFFKYDKERMPQIPSLFVVIDNQDTPIETRIIGNYLIAETTAEKFTIRLGESYICVERLKPNDKRLKNKKVESQDKEINKLFLELKPKTQVELSSY